MKIINSFLFIKLLSAFLLFFIITEANSQQPMNSELDQVRLEIKIIKDQQSEIRRDQLNYRTEKDTLKEVYSVSNNTLKEAYSSTISGIQIALSVALGIITIVGFFGVRNIGEIKKDYVNDLQNLRTLKSSFDLELELFKKNQAEAVAKVDEIEASNLDQEQRLKVLEIQERARSAFDAKDYSRALEFVLIGLELSADDNRLCSLKAMCLAKLGQFEDAAVAQQHLLSLPQPATINVRVNLAEFYLLAKRPGDYQKLIDEDEAVRSRIAQQDKLINYFEILRLFVDEDFKGIKQAIEKLLKLDDKDDLSPRMGKWGFDEVMLFVKSAPSSAPKQAMINALGYLSGQANKTTILNNISKL
jgi:tetratricopeptide (TPR) repeat protein